MHGAIGGEGGLDRTRGMPQPLLAELIAIVKRRVASDSMKERQLGSVTSFGDVCPHTVR